MNEKTEPTTITVDQVMAWEPCKDWPRVRVLAYAGDRTEVPLLEILQDESLDIRDRVCLGCNALPEIRWWCADRARIHAVDALDQAGLHDLAQTMRDLNPVVDKTTARAMKVVAEAAAWAADRAAYWAARAAGAAARAAGTVAWAAWAADWAAWAAGAAARAAGTVAWAAWAADWAAWAAGAAARATAGTDWTAAEAARAAGAAAERQAQLDRLIEMAGLMPLMIEMAKEKQNDD